jgi:hypothetical protein
MKIDVEKIKTAYEAASAEQKRQIEKMFPGAFECAKSNYPEEALETLVDKLRTWQSQNKDNRAVALFAADKDRTEEEGNTAICITGSSAVLLNLALNAGTCKDSKEPIIKLFALALMNNVKDNLKDDLKDNLENKLKDSKHGTDN